MTCIGHNEFTPSKYKRFVFRNLKCIRSNGTLHIDLCIYTNLSINLIMANLSTICGNLFTRKTLTNQHPQEFTTKFLHDEF